MEVKRITVKWDTVCAPPKEGGMGLRKLKDINNSCLMKMAWGILQKDGEWAQYMTGKYTARNGTWTRSKTSSIWPGIRKGI
ncbi:hypothetical protein FRX31_018358, partial [Thalictrum thalictroides]